MSIDSGRRADALSNRIKLITEGGIISPRPEEDCVPQELSAFVDNEEHMASLEQFWENVNIDRLRRYLQETRVSLNSQEGIEDYLVHKAVRDHLDSVQGYVAEVSRQMGMNPKLDGSDEHRKVQKASWNMATIRGELDPTMLRPFVLKLKDGKRPATNYKGDGIHEKPQMTLQECVPFLHLINGVFTRKFDKKELDYLIHQLTGYAFDSVRQLRPEMRPYVAKKAIPVLEEMLESLKSYANE